MPEEYIVIIYWSLGHLSYALLWFGTKYEILNWTEHLELQVSAPRVSSQCAFTEAMMFLLLAGTVFLHIFQNIVLCWRCWRNTTSVSQTHCQTCPGSCSCLGIVKSCRRCIINIVMTLMDIHSTSCKYYWSQLVKISNSKIAFDHNFKVILFSTQILNKNEYNKVNKCSQTLSAKKAM